MRLTAAERREKRQLEAAERKRLREKYILDEIRPWAIEVVGTSGTTESASIVLSILQTSFHKDASINEHERKRRLKIVTKQRVSLILSEAANASTIGMLGLKRQRYFPLSWLKQEKSGVASEPEKHPD